MFVFGVIGKNWNDVKTVTRTIGKAMFLAKSEVQDNIWEEDRKYLGIVKTDKDPILSRQFEEFDAAIVLDNIDTKNIGRYVKNNSTILFNAKSKPSLSMKDKKAKTMFLDASSLCIDLKCKSYLLMIGASTKLYPKLSLKNAKDVLAENPNAVDEGFKNVK